MLRWQSGILSWSNETQISLGTRPRSDPRRGLVFCQTAAFKPEPLQLWPWQKNNKAPFFFLSFLIRESAISVLNIRALDPFFFFFFSRRIHDGAETEHGKNHQPLKAICLTRWWVFKTVRPLCHLCPSHSVPGTSRCASLCAPDCFLTLFTAISPYLRPPY